MLGNYSRNNGALRKDRIQSSICKYTSELSGNTLAHIPSVSNPIPSASSDDTQLLSPPLELEQKVVLVSEAYGVFLLDDGNYVIQRVLQPLQSQLEVVGVTVIAVGR